MAITVEETFTEQYTGTSSWTRTFAPSVITAGDVILVNSVWLNNGMTATVTATGFTELVSTSPTRMRLFYRVVQSGDTSFSVGSTQTFQAIRLGWMRLRGAADPAVRSPLTATTYQQAEAGSSPRYSIGALSGSIDSGGLQLVFALLGSPPTYLDLSGWTKVLTNSGAWNDYYQILYKTGVSGSLGAINYPDDNPANGVLTGIHVALQPPSASIAIPVLMHHHFMNLGLR